MQLFLHRNQEKGGRKTIQHASSCCMPAVSGKAMPEPLGSREAHASKVVAIGALALGALAIGAFAIGTLVIGKLILGNMTIGRAHIKKLAIDELTVKHSSSGKALCPESGWHSDAGQAEQDQ